MINKVILVGRITKDPELRFVNVDIPLVKFVLAVNRNYVNSSGIKEVDFIRCSVWNKQAENLAKYISKGTMLGIEGSIRVTTSEVNNQKQFFVDVHCDNIQFLESKNKRDSNQSNYYDDEYKKTEDKNYSHQNNEHSSNDKKLIIDNNEDLPF
ncbi:single-stranded DNA-binding protein [Candidatus Phytoplasma luffae]|uniref:Single-stranded DNA-binding protein n=1 Tax=Loofah witches'-broom phytoplasma TaxID=35773 RepID=A0A975FJJ6_LOWBP|nr:single-stranded DNA-binding protein [Candidatus Phytoplasma luffae]QTX02882.1 single-stranded DNA-binding protein [Candidatus Phytoplasma luffae]QTX03019.1 single-stranded DNA-binding protein [Candidatus Phytoplasma luffae]